MQVLVLYFSKGGNTRKLAEAIAKGVEEIDGAALEGLVAQHLLAWNSYRGEKNSLYYWRTRSGSEVDFIFYGKEVFWAIEVKNSSRVGDSDLRALASFKEEYPECETILLYRGKEGLLKNGIRCMPCEKFLQLLSPDVVPDLRS